MATHIANYTGTVPCVLVFPALMTPEAFQGKGDTLRYKGNFLYPEDHPDVPVIQAAILSVASAAFPGRDPSTLKLPFARGSVLNARREQKGRKPYDFYNDRWVLAAQKPQKDSKGNLLPIPRLVVLQNGKFVPYVDGDRPAASAFFYSGVKAVPVIQFANYSAIEDGISGYLNRVLSLNTGERIMTGPDDNETFGGAERFSQYMGTVTSHDPTAGMAAAPQPW